MLFTSIKNAAVYLLQKAIHPVTIVIVFIAVLGALYVVESKWQHMPFVALIIILLAGLAYVATRRIAFSVYLSLTIVLMATLMSVAKFRGKGFDLHVYDFAFTGSDIEAVKFLLTEFSGLIVPVIIALTVSIAGLCLIWSGEKPVKNSILLRVVPVAVAAILLPFAYPIKSSEPRYFYYLAGFNASSFFISFLDIAELFTKEPVVARANAVERAEPFASKHTCDGFETRPDIYVVLSESATNFKNYPQLNIKNVPEDAFRSQDGKLRDLRVETFGGGTWVSNLSLMTGLPTTRFGWRSPYLTIQLEDRVKASLATLLNGCGYRSAAVMPMKYSFVNEGPFLASIGFDSILDYDRIGASLYNHRDDFYYGAADRFIADHMASDKRPLFLQVQTMFAHSPFEEPREPQIQFQDEPFSDDPLLNEHIRRVYIAQNDFRDFIERRKEMQPDRPFVVLEFGDHQTQAMRSLADEISGGGSLVDMDSVAYRTQYSLHTHNFDLDMKRFDWEQLDIGYLGVTFMQAIGVPLPPMYEDLAALRDHCRGFYSDCADEAAVARHLNRRISSGLLSLPGS